jgi:hypothetical protein
VDVAALIYRRQMLTSPLQERVIGAMRILGICYVSNSTFVGHGTAILPILDVREMSITEYL